ncbi:hypothetical protein TWF192_008776 [Orbilia oligospora]|uniref:ER lumen protein-retaining receptor n=2 Tax=Orbilia oligospora TaxID=2813651 RepID=A0A6G1M1J2_ORBOL|nr:hypothetical protein TWF191_006553 [Orbilia oligospora]KAF3242002.1 hypothetical protein TWF192_008776 [Orbilia oligospora]
MGLNAFRIIADLSHLSSKLILIWAIHSNRSAEGVSLITQGLYLLVFLTRYVDIFWISLGWWNTTLKIFYILSSSFILLLMTKIFPRTQEPQKALRFGAWCLGGSLILTMPVTAFINGYFTFWENVWVFSIILESVCVLPQLLLLRRTSIPTVIDSYYLVALGSYRGFYILNWIWRNYTEFHYDPVSSIFGVIQTALYIDFAWVYYSRQRIKLRGGALIDEDEVGRGWLLGRILGGDRHVDHQEELRDVDVENGDSNHRSTSGLPQHWGPRGISVSADDGILDLEADADAQHLLADPDQFEVGDQEDVDAVEGVDLGQGQK